MMGNPPLSADFYRKVLARHPEHKQARQEVRRGAWETVVCMYMYYAGTDLRGEPWVLPVYIGL